LRYAALRVADVASTRSWNTSFSIDRRKAGEQRERTVAGTDKTSFAPTGQS